VLIVVVFAGGLNVRFLQRAFNFASESGATDVVRTASAAIASTSRKVIQASMSAPVTARRSQTPSDPAASNGSSTQTSNTSQASSNNKGKQRARQITEVEEEETKHEEDVQEASRIEDSGFANFSTDTSRAHKRRKTSSPTEDDDLVELGNAPAVANIESLKAQLQKIMTTQCQMTNFLLEAINSPDHVSSIGLDVDTIKSQMYVRFDFMLPTSG
jgi:hypothetical protein